MGLTAHYSDRHPSPTVHTERELFMINEDGFRSLSSATISRRRLLGGLAGSAVLLAADPCSPVVRAPAPRRLAPVPRRRRPPASAPRRPTMCRSGPSPRWSSAFEKKSGDKVNINTKSHNDFQNNINSYLQGSPDDTFTWFAGYRMRYYASKGLVAPLDDVWEKLGGNFGEGIVKASTGDDGKKYFVPNYNYPWAILLPQERLAGQGLRDPEDLRRAGRRCAAQDEEATA